MLKRSSWRRWQQQKPWWTARENQRGGGLRKNVDATTAPPLCPNTGGNTDRIPAQVPSAQVTCLTFSNLSQIDVQTEPLLTSLLLLVHQPPWLWRESSGEIHSSVLMNWTPCSPTLTPAQGLAVSVTAQTRQRGKDYPETECSLSSHSLILY